MFNAKNKFDMKTYIAQLVGAVKYTVSLMTGNTCN